MHISYKIGLFLIFILSISFHHSRAAPSINQTSLSDEDYGDDYDDDYYDDDAQQSQKSDEDSKPSLLATTAATIQGSLFNLFNIPTRSNHVVEPVCPKPCLCLEDYKYIDCSRGRLVAVPEDIPATAVIVDLSHNRIKEIRATDFSNRPRLQEINLSNNLIEKIEPQMLQGLPHLQRLRLSSNRLSELNPDTFRGASDLSLLDLSNNSIKLPENAPFLHQRSLLELNCRNCSWTSIYEETFRNTSMLTALRIDQNDFNKKINTQAFVPLKNLIKLRLPELDQNSTEELCNLLKFIDNISFKRFEVSCYELVLGTSYNESIILVTDPPYKQPVGVRLTTTEKQPPNIATTTAAREQQKIKKMNINETLGASSNFSSTNGTNDTVVLAGMEPAKKGVAAAAAEEESYKVAISQEAINFMLIGLMVLSVIGIIIGVICRKDVGGIKTKCCRTKKPAAGENGETITPAAEEIPLNKIS